MIEPFEFETIRLQAPQPSGKTGKAVIHGKGSIDEEEIKSFSTLKQTEDAIPLDSQRLRIYQSKIGNPSSIDSHKADYVPERVVSLGPIAVNYEEKTTPVQVETSVSELLSKFLDQDMSFVPSTDKHHMPSFNINSPNAPFQTPGLTSIDAHKVKFNWV